jgi:hypothetical protein
VVVVASEVVVVDVDRFIDKKISVHIPQRDMNREH